MSSRYRYSRSSSGRQRQKLDFDFKQMDSRVYFGGALAVIVLFGTLFYLLVVTMLPMKVNNSLAHMTPETVALSMQPAVSERLAERSFTLLVDGREELFYLGDYDFTVSPHSDGYSEEITYTDENGMEKTKIITTKGNLCFNETAVRQFIYDLAKEYGTPMVEPHYTIKGDKMTVYKGTDGIGIDYNYLIAALSQRIAAGDNSPITTQIITLVAPEVDIDEIYRKVKCAPENAYVTLDAAGNPKFTADIIGKDFDLTAARNRMEASPDAGQWEIQLTLTYPEISLKQVRAPYCLDELSDCTTSYKGSSAERRNNVEQAATKINTYNGNQSVAVYIKEIKYSDDDSERILNANRAFESLLCGRRLSQTVLKRLLPERGDFAVVYRYLRNNGGYRYPVETLTHRLGGKINFGRIRVILEAMKQLSLINYTEGMSDSSITLNPTSGKVSLEAAPVIKAIKEAIQ